MKIDIILPVNNTRILTNLALQKLNLPSEIQCDIKLPKNNYHEITSADDEKAVTPSIIDAVIDSEKKDADAIIVYCFGEPGVEEARSKVNIPVFGIASPAMHMAAQLGKYFSVIASVEAHCPLIDKLADQFGLLSKMKPARSIDISPDKLVDSDEILFSRIIALTKKSIEDDGVDTFVLGCGSMQSKAESIKKLIKEKLGYDVAVVDPLPTAIHFLNAVVLSKLSPSKKAYSSLVLES